MGSFNNGLKEGKGILKNENKEIYEGDWSHNFKHGKGKMIYLDGEIYEGEWQNDKRTGIGKLTHKNGDIYLGEFLEDKKHGKGNYQDSLRNELYDCSWEYDAMEGFGMIYINEKLAYEGIVFNNFERFNGKFIMEDKVFIGEMYNRQFHGKGTLLNFNQLMYSNNQDTHTAFVH